MSVTEVRTVSVEGTVGPDGHRSYVVMWEVDTNDANDGPITAWNAAAIPSRFTSFSHGNDLDLFALLKSKQSQLILVKGSYKRWRVTGNYDSKSEPEEDQELVNDPLDRRTRWSGSFVQFTRDFWFDKDDKVIKNSADDLFVDPPVMGDDSRLSIIAQKNFAALDVDTWAEFRDAVNDATQWGLTARKIKVQSITWEQRFHNNQPYFDVRFEFHVKDETWDVKVLDAGFYEKTATGAERQRITEKLGRDVNIKAALTAAGVVMPTTDREADNENTLTFKIYNEKDFTLLGLPNTIGDA